MEEIIKSEVSALEDLACAKHESNRLKEKENKLEEKEIYLQILFKDITKMTYIQLQLPQSIFNKIREKYGLE